MLHNSEKRNPATFPQLQSGDETSIVIDSCQVCGNEDLKSIIFLGYMPPVNEMRNVGSVPHEQPYYPLGLLYCSRCELVQIGLSIAPRLLFPESYPYTSGTTRILRDNFADLYQQSSAFVELTPKDLVIDVGSNDGTLLSNFAVGHSVLGIEPTDVGRIAQERGIPTMQQYFSPQVARKVRAQQGPAKIVTCTNCFAHMENVHPIAEGILEMLSDDGVFISESHYLISLLDTLQYDTVYHEHLRYYSLHSLKYLLEMHELEVVHAVRIPTHGGSIRVYAARKGTRPVQSSVGEMLRGEPTGAAMEQRLAQFAREVMLSKLGLLEIIWEAKKNGARICGLGAPARGSTLISYVGLDGGMIDYVGEVKGSLKLGKYMPGTLIPVVDESRLFEDKPEYALILSWHIAEGLMPKLRAMGYTGKFIIPLPTPRVV
jgi:hypothetical protein